MHHDQIPARTSHDRGPDLLREGHEFVQASRRRLGGPDPDQAVEVRLLGTRAVLLGGPEGVRLFYDRARFRRRDAVPRPIGHVLFGRGALHTHDGETHRRRKAVFLDLLDDAGARELATLADRFWQRAVDRWTGTDHDVVLFDEAVRVLGATACIWAGLPLEPVNAPRRIRDLARIVDGFAAVGPAQVHARRARLRSERWVTGVVREVRSGRRTAAPGSAVERILAHRDPDGSELDDRTAAVELLNVVRPTVAVAWFVTFAGLALHRNPDWRQRLSVPRKDDTRLEQELEAFAEEVRRFYPFAPFVAARVRNGFFWRGHDFPEGRLVLLDLHGTDHDPRLWPDPETFDPGRFLRGTVPADGFVPQGGGDPATGHRCPGERVTVELLKGAVHLLARLGHQVPDQDLGYSLARIPTRPRSAFLIRDVRRAPDE